MNNKLRKLLMSGFQRRRKEVMRICIATFLAVFFISGVLLFQENMYQWQMAENRKQFGDWFVLESYAQTKALIGHEDLKEAVTAKNYVRMYDDNWTYTKGTVGWMSEDFMKQGNIRLADGRLPVNDNEIVCDYNTLTKLGYTAELGQEIHFQYYHEDKKSSTSEPERSASFILTGVLENYADVWNGSRHLPGAFLTEEGCAKLDATGYMVYIYQLKDSVRLNDYQPLYDELSGYNSKRLYFNTNLYDFKPWGPSNIYNYIYLLVMVIGIAALTYQIISYQHSRTEHYRRMYYLGTARGTIWQSRFLENVLILVPSGLLGVLGAFLTGRGIGWLLELKKEVAFFHVNLDVTLKSLLSILIALVAAELVNLYMTYVSKMDFVGSRISTRKLKNRKSDQEKLRENSVNTLNKSTITKDKPQRSLSKQKLRKNNATWQLHVRLSRSDGIALRLGVRVFALGITGILVFCAMNIYDAFRVYKKYEEKSDISGFQTQESDTSYYINIAYDLDKEIDGYPEDSAARLAAERIPMLTFEEYKTFQNNIQESREKSSELREKGLYNPETDVIRVPIGVTTLKTSDIYLHNGNATILQGLDETLMERISKVHGIQSVSFSSYETARNWYWDTMDLNQMGYKKLTASSTDWKKPGYQDIYLYGTTYIDPTEALYQRLSKYIDTSRIDYEAFRDGKQVVVFLRDELNDGEHDQSIQAGTNLNFQYYNIPVTKGDAMTTEDVAANEELPEPLYPYFDKIVSLSDGKFYQDVVETEGKTTKSYTKILDAAKTDEYLEAYYNMKYAPCVTSQVAAVVYLNDEIKEELNDIIPNFAYYTAVASTELGKEACKKQNELIRDFFTEEELGADFINYEFQYNQLSAIYTLDASYSATDNILKSYFNVNNVVFSASAADKEKYRTNTLNAILQYGMTAIAAIVINILIYTILTRNRLELRKKKLQLLMQMGAEKSRIRRICLIEIVRESLWCIFTAPLQILVQYVNCRRGIK